MASLLASLLIKLGLDTAELKSGVSVAERDLQRATKRIEKIGNNMADTGRKLSMAVTLPIIAMTGLAVQGALDQRAAVAQVEAAITSMGNAAGRSSEQLAKNADALEMNSLVDADVILTKVTANLLTFGNVAGEVFDRAQQSAIDMAQRLGSDPQAAAVMLGKALNDPIKGITALTRVGVQFTEAQKEQIKAFMKTGEVAKAQGIILTEVERQFAGAAKAAAETSPWRQATVAINQAADAIGEVIIPILPVLTDLVVNVGQAFSNLSPTMQTVIVVCAALAAAFGPILVAIGSVTTALAGKLVTALIAYRSGLLATVATQGLATAATNALAIALRGLMIATGVGLAITALAGAYFILTGRTVETTAAQRAHELQGIRTAAALDIERKASEQLAAASGKERGAVLAAMQASRARAAQSLQTAQAKLKEARASLALAQAESNRRIAAATQSSRGAGGGTDPAMVELYRRDRVLGPVEAQLKAAEEKYNKALGMLDGLDKSIRDFTPVDLPKIDVGNVDAGGAAAGRASRAVRGLSDAARDAKQSAEELQSLLDRLFPDAAEARKFQQETALLNSQFKAGKLTLADYERALLALRREYIGFADLMKQSVEIDVVPGTKSIEQLNQELIEKSETAFGGVSKKAEVTKVQVVESFSQMIDGALQQLDRFAQGIKSGNWLDIIGGLLNAIDGIAAALSGGNGFNIGDLKIGNRSGTMPRYANGTDFHPGGLAIVGERGREIVNLPRGSQVHSNRELQAMGGSRNYFDLRGAVMTEDLLRQMNGMVSSGIAQAAPAIANAGANQALGMARRQQARALD